MIQLPITLKGESEEDIWKEMERNWAKEDDFLSDFQILLEQAGKKILLYIDIDLGGGFEGGYELTRFSADIQSFPDLHFVIHDKDLFDDLGMLLGMEDTQIGYPDFDEKLNIKTNNASALKDLFSNDSLRELFLTFGNHTLSFYTNKHDPTSKVLTLEIEEGITDILKLRRVYHAFFEILSKIETTTS